MERVLKLCISILHEFGSQTKKYSEGNNLSFITKTKKSAFLKRNFLTKRSFENCSDNNK